MTKEEKLQQLQAQLNNIQKEIERLNEPESYYVVVTKREESNWYEVGEVYKVMSELSGTDQAKYHALVGGQYVGVSPDHIIKITDQRAIDALEATDIKFYD